MWALARPLIEEWVIFNRGPEARLRHMVTDTISTLEQLPQLLGRAEAVTKALRDGQPVHKGREDRVFVKLRADWILYGLLGLIVILLLTNL